MWFLGVACWWAGSASAAGDADEAEITFDLGTRAYGQRSYESALAQFLASNRLAPNPSVAYNIARCYAALGKYAEAYRWLTVARQGLTAPSVLKAVDDELARITPLIVVYDVTSDPPGARVYVERKDLGVIGITPFKWALSPQDAPRQFLFELDGHEGGTVDGVQGLRGQRVPVGFVLKQIVGTVVVSAPPGTAVHRGAPDGPVLCVAPCEASLAPDNWVLYFRLDGHRDVVRQINVDADQRVTVEVDPAPATGAVYVETPDRGARVEIDGVAVGTAPVLVQNVRVGERVVRISQPGYAAVEERVIVTADRQVDLRDVRLIPLDEVSAVSRRPEPVELAPASVTVITAEELRAFRYPTMYEALRGVRGFALSHDGIYGLANVRGIGQPGDYNNRMLVLQDGATLNDGVLAQGYIRYDGRVDLEGIDRIEVVRGPGSVLYGTGAVSGVVNMVTEPIMSPEGSEVGVSLADADVMRAYASSHYNFSDSVGFRASASFGTSAGRAVDVDPLGSPDPLILDGVDSFRAGTTTGRLWFGDASLQWFHTWRSVLVPNEAFFTEYQDPEQDWEDTRTLVELRYEPKITASTRVLSRAWFNRYRYNAELAFTGGAAREDYLGASAGGEVRLVAEAGDLARLTVGGVAEVFPQIRLLGEATEGYFLGEYLNTSAPYQIAAGYALADFSPGDTLYLSAGARLDYWSKPGAFSVSPRFSAIFTPSNTDYFKFVVGRSFRAPSIYEFAYSSPLVVAPVDLAPETVWSGEAEYTHKFDPVLSMVVAAHASSAQAFIESASVAELGQSTTSGYGSALTLVNSADEIRNLGADVEVRRSFLDGWMFSMWYSYLYSRYISVDGDVRVLPNVPEHQSGAKLVVPISPPFARLAFRSSLEAPRRIMEGSAAATELAVVSDLVLSGSVPERRLEYAVGAYNLFDQSYGLPISDGFPIGPLTQQGRSFLVSLSIGF